jgi:ketosteroid isomerase-like protein
MCSFIQGFFMRLTVTILLGAVVYVMLACVKPSAANERSTIDDVRAFMANYDRMLQERDMEGIADLYADSALLSIQGTSQMLSRDSIRAMYIKSSREPIDFRWEDIRIQPMNANVVLVTTVFYWGGDGPSSYTGVFLKTENGWRITHEHESFRSK